MKTPKIKILILNYNGRTVLKDCLDSVSNIIYPNYTTVLIDNASSDSSVEFVESSYNDIEIIHTGKNRFYAGGYNYFFNRDSEQCYYMILNNDTIVDRDILTRFMEGVNKYGKGHIYGARIMFVNNKNKIWYAGSKVNLFKGIIRHLNIRKDVSSVALKDSLTDYVTGCCMIVKKSIYDDLGGFDESFFMYNEDVDFCLRAKLNKIKCVYLPSVIISHKVSSSLGGYYSRKKILMKIKSAFLLYKKYYSKPRALLLLVKYCIRLLMSVKL